MKDKKKSKAGKIGASTRWANHDKLTTKQIRVFEYDYEFISFLAEIHGSFAKVVKAALKCYCKCHDMKYAPRTWVE